VGVLIGPIALLNKPSSDSTPHLLLCNLPSVSAQEQVKKSRRKALQSVAEGQQQIVTEEQQQQKVVEEQQQQHRRATRGCGEKPLSPTAIAAAEAQSRSDLAAAAGKRKVAVTTNTMLSQDRLLPHVSVRLHSSRSSGRLILSTNEELLLGYGNAYGVYES
jgi:hypothetical protein